MKRRTTYPRRAPVGQSPCPPGFSGYTDETGTYCEPNEPMGVQISEVEPPASPMPEDPRARASECVDCKAPPIGAPGCGSYIFRKTIVGDEGGEVDLYKLSKPGKFLKIYMISWSAADGDVHDVRIEFSNPVNPSTDRILLYDDGGTVSTVAVVLTNYGAGYLVPPIDSNGGVLYKLFVFTSNLVSGTLVLHYGYVDAGRVV